ncbi:MAG: hypothetical protein HYV77_02225 [Candidatus Wildermuthbacteria bacterium]|nr:hypothetical protein [Candidatus Wildermuthbacteria bacterium]
MKKFFPFFAIGTTGVMILALGFFLLQSNQKENKTQEKGTTGAKSNESKENEEGKSPRQFEETLKFSVFNCADSKGLEKENQPLHTALLEEGGSISNYYRSIWECKDQALLSNSIELAYGELTGDLPREAIVRYRGGAGGKVHAYGVYQFVNGAYRKMMSRGDSNWGDPRNGALFDIRNQQLIVAENIYREGDAECCPSDHAVIFYWFDGRKLEVEKILNDQKNDITKSAFIPLDPINLTSAEENDIFLWRNYRDAEAEAEIRYPANWSVEKSKNGMVSFRSVDGKELVFCPKGCLADTKGLYSRDTLINIRGTAEKATRSDFYSRSDEKYRKTALSAKGTTLEMRLRLGDWSYQAPEVFEKIVSTFQFVPK